MAAQGLFVDWKGKAINKDKHGGAKATRFIYFLVVMMNMAFTPTLLNMVMYLQTIMHMGIASSSTTITNLIGVTCAFALVGGFLSDAYITRFKAILIFGPLEFLGFALLALQARLPSLRPPECDAQTSDCKHVHGSNATLLYIAMYVAAFGEGCLRANLPSLGGDQFDDEDSTELQLKSSYFNWFTFNLSLGSLLGVLFITWIQNNTGWDVGFSVPAGVVLLGVIVVASGFSFYRNQIPKGSPLTRMLQVFVAAFRNRKLQFPENEEVLYLEHNKEDMVGEVLPHTKGFKWLDKAFISSRNTGNWYFCSVSQVEEMKIVLRMLPIFVSAMIGYIPVPQLLTFTITQGNTMDTRLGKIHISPTSLLAIPIILQMVILVVYDRFFVPFARRITGCRTGITHLQRVGVGFIATSLASCTGAVIERKRKRIAEEHGLLDSGNQLPMSVMWLALQFLALGINDISTFTGLLEFFNTEASRGMKSLGTAIFWCNLGLASLLGSVLVNLTNKVTRHGGTGWLEGNNLNRDHLDRFYWLLTVLGLVAFLNYLFWARRYTYRQHNLGPTS
ncbi:Proton-dependent oligopeptide transporter family [Macleaya cordata]|uniref:Proton-dependent oligopeptide transporter family n=1 Tax=Macleaya cordata TaxID=56857 RepID=A0A200Q2E1_MACCD|nr:Proton-dependent oligopeptide transporter family [Macleaya cordata]